MNDKPLYLTRQEKQLIRCFRSLPPERQLALLAEVESSWTAFARMEELAARQTERTGSEEGPYRH